MRGFVPDPRPIFHALHQAGVRYLLVGGQAAILHGVPRNTYDVDILVEDSKGNLRRLRKALEKIDSEEATLLPEDAFSGRQAMMFGDEPRLDIFLKLPGVRAFHLARRDARRFRVQGIMVSALSLEDLMAAKRRSRAFKDQADLEALKTILSRSRPASALHPPRGRPSKGKNPPR